MLKRSVSKIEPCVCPNLISNQVMYALFVFFLYFLFDKLPEQTLDAVYIKNETGRPLSRI